MTRSSSLLLLLGVQACAGTDVGNPPSQVTDTEVTVSLRGVDRGAPSGLVLATGDEVTEAWVVIDKLRLRGAESCEGNAAADDVTGPIVAELVSGRELPSAPSFTRQDASFCRLQVSIRPLGAGEVAGAPAELAGTTLLLRGRRADGVPFVLRSDLGQKLQLDARTAPFTGADGQLSLEVRFAIDAWLSAADLAGAELSDVDGVPTIEIDHDRNKDSLEAVEHVLDDSLSLWRDDDDGDDEVAKGRLDDDEEEHVEPGEGGHGGEGGSGGEGDGGHGGG